MTRHCVGSCGKLPLSILRSGDLRELQLTKSGKRNLRGKLQKIGIGKIRVC